MTHKWELVEDGYHRRSRYVEFPSGRIVGGVSGSTFENDGWDAQASGCNIGSYITEDLAKRAVEAAVTSQPGPEA